MVVLQVIETISIVIPAMPVYICSGILFGKAVGIAICYTTNLILNILIFLAARKMKYVKSKVLNLNTLQQALSDNNTCCPREYYPLRVRKSA